jgi:hypothetical protein
VLPNAGRRFSRPHGKDHLTQIRKPSPDSRQSGERGSPNRE